LLLDTKNDKSRKIPISYALTSLCDYWAGRERLPQQPIFQNSDGGFPFNYHRPWAEIREKAELEDFTFHDLRHTAASYLVQEGVPIAEISQLLGHKSIQTTLRYAHLDAGRVLKTGAVLETILKR